MKLNREQIVKALECCTSDTGCSGCPRFLSLLGCSRQNMADALALIRELTEEKERLERENARYEAENNAEFNKWLKLEEATKRHHAELFQEAKIAVRADTVRKMQERLKKAPIKVGLPLFGLQTKDEIEDYANELILQMRDAIDQIAKEVLGENK